MKSKRHSPETRAKISAKRRTQSPPMLGKKHSPETISKMRAAAEGRIVPRCVIEAGAKSRRGKPAWNRGLSSWWIKGDKSPLWKGGVLKGYDKKLSSLEWRGLRKKVYERDNWTCKDCGVKCRETIQCHHVVPYRESMDDSMENLITLCRKCHCRRHADINRRVRENKRILHSDKGTVRYKKGD